MGKKDISDINLYICINICF